MSCRVKYFETVYSKAGVGKTSAIRMKEDLLFLPVGGKNEDNKSLMTVDNVYNWAKNIEKKVDEEFNNIKGQDGLKIYGKLLNLVKVNTGPRPGVQIIINYPVDLHKALELKNKQISEQEYINYYKNNNITEKENDQLKLFQLSAQPKSQIKPGVQELFESNPELANQVYEALGFKSKPDVILPIGTSGSGKSTFIKSLPQDNLVVIEPDAMRVEFTGDMNDKSKDKEIYEEAAKRAVKAIKQGKQVVFDTTNLTKDKRLPFIEAIKKEIPNANIQYKLMELNPELAKQRIKAQLERGENRANVSDATIDRHAESYKQMLEDIKSEPISNYEITQQQKQQAQQLYSQYLDTIFPDSKVKDIVYHGTHTKFDKFDKSLVGSKTRATIKGKGFFFSNSSAIAQGYRQSLDNSNIYNDVIFYYYFKRDLGNQNINTITEKEWQDIILNYFGNEDLNVHYLQNQSLEKTKALFKKFKTDKQFDTVKYSDELDFSKYIKDDSIVYSVVLNSRNPLIVEGNNYQMLSIVKKEIEKLKDTNDSIIFNNVEDGIAGGYRDVATTYTVFEPEQIHILGSKQDIEGFKEFVKGTSQQAMFMKTPEVNYSLKLVSALGKISRNKFEASKLQGWLNDLQKQGVTAQQLELFKEVAKPGMTKDEIAAAILANYSYTIEINTATQRFDPSDDIKRTGSFTIGYDEYIIDYPDRAGQPIEYYLNGNLISQQEFENAALASGNLQKKSDTKPTQYYSNLTVPGGTNYTENEIATPAITPSIKGHAQFATEKGIGWFRSDEVGTNFKEYTYEEAERIHGIVDSTTPTGQFYSGSKTRRILEVQSDLFQKGRDKENLASIPYSDSKKLVLGSEKLMRDYNKGLITREEYNKKLQELSDFVPEESPTKNQFLQLLNKDNNWVTFFVKSIIQDSAKKGYEKVLFPSGDTASKIEGHETLEDFKKQKEDRIKELENADKSIIATFVRNEDGSKYTKYFKTRDDLYSYSNETGEEIVKIVDNQLEINQLKKELERVETEGFGALKPIYNFYENTITNILKKQGYNPVLITDEYGNTWNEVKIKPEQLNTILLQLKSEQTDSKEIIEQIDKNLNDYIKNNNINIEFKNQVLDSNGNDVVAFYDGVKKVIEINEGKRDSKTLPEELAHHLHLALGKDHILVKRAFNLLNRVDYKAMLGQEYVDLYKNNTDLLKFEILGKLTAAAVRGEKIPLQMNTVEGNKLWDTIKRMINAVIKLFKSDANVQKELDNLTNQFANILKSGAKIDSESALKFKLYQFNQNNFDIKTDFIMSPKNFKLLDEGKKTVTLRNTNYPSGIYKFGENYYKVHNKFNEPVYLNDVQDSDLKKKFIGSEEIIKDYVDAFFKNEEKMYVYYIEKLDDVTQKLIKDQVENSRQALINIDINVKAAYVYYNKLLKKLKKDNLNYPDPNNPIRKSNEQKIKDIDLALKELTRLDNIQPLINLVNITLDEIDSYINRLDLILNNGGKPNFSNVSSTLATLNKLIDFPTTEKTAAELRRRLNVYLQMAVKEETDRLTGRDNKYDELFGLQEDISTAKKNFGTLVDIKNLLGRSLGLLIKESQNNIERDNSEIYNLIKEKTDNLEKWAKSENINLQKAYDILQQEYRGTYVLTKPYTSDFYKLINDSFDKPNGHEIRKKIATFDNNTKEFIPLNKKYVNSNYTKIQNTPALKEYYEFFKATTKNVSDNILPLNLSDNFIPNIYQKTLIDIFNTEEALDEKTKKAVQHILDFNIFEKMTDDKKYLFDESLMEGDLDLKYLKNLPTDVKSKDLSYNLLKFMYFANSYNHMSEVLEKAKVFLEVSKNVKFIKSNDPTLSIQGDKSSTYDMMQSFFDMQVLGKLKKEQKIEVLGYNFNYGNLFDLLTGFTSLLRLGLNPFNAIANVLTGTVGNVIEATGGRYFNIADYIKARKIFAEMVIDTDSKLYKLIYKINPLQELDDYENLKKIGIGTAKYWEKVKSIMFSPQRFGEFNLQTTPMIAIMLHTDVDIIKNGKVVGKTKMWDAFNEDGEWDTAKMGYELSDFELNRLTNKIHRVNQMIHGRYSSKDASILSQDVFFRMAFQFKKWIPAAIESRLGAEQYDERLDDTVKGRWRSYGPFIKYYMGGLWSKAIGDAKALENNKPLSDIDKYNMYKNAVELIIAAGILLLTKGIEDEEDKKKAWYKLTMRQLNQLSGDLLYFYNPKEMSESAFGGVAAAKTIKDIARTVNYIPYAFADKNNQKAYYRSGKRKHENKFWAGMLDITPGAKSITESVRLFKGDVPYTEPVD